MSALIVEINAADFKKKFGGVLQQAKNPTAMLKAAGRELFNQLVRHFRRRDMENPNRLGGKREHFWLQVARSVHTPAQTSANSVTVNIADPRIAQKVWGGLITPKRGQFLTIPLTAEAYGHTASDFPGLFLLRTPKGAWLVKYGETFTASGKISTAKIGKYRIRASLNFLFKLVRSVDQLPDLDALPEHELLANAVLNRANEVLVRQLQNPTGTAGVSS